MKGKRTRTGWGCFIDMVERLKEECTRSSWSLLFRGFGWMRNCFSETS